MFSNQKENQFKGFYNIIEIKHSIPGRIRFKIPLLKCNDKYGEILQAQLPKIKSIEKFSWSSISGSLIINYNNSELSSDIILGIIIKLLRLESIIEKEPNSNLGMKLVSFEKNLNRSVYEKSHGAVDFRSLIHISFIVLGVASMFKKNKTTPGPYSLLYWAYNGISKRLQ
ncbi:MAG: HMA2 domain-containing protein [Bacteroidales bacterium]